MSESIVTLTLTPDNPCNTTITGEDNEAVYIVYTEHGKNASTTQVLNAEDKVVASLVWRDTGVHRDMVTLGGGTPKWLRSWLSKSIVPFKDDVSFKDNAGRRYKWKGNAPGRSLELYTSEDAEEPIARFFKSRMDNKSDPPSLTPATLLLAPRAMEIRDIVVSSFLFLERDRRTNEKSIVSRSNALAAAARGGAMAPSNFA
ncbi:hypothetical protein AcW1_008086 [Taiwanofungus camphoratus]|nr:hypothetical protein AcW1_008086 [Antrodia cinnamomea]